MGGADVAEHRSSAGGGGRGRYPPQRALTELLPSPFFERGEISYESEVEFIRSMGYISKVPILSGYLGWCDSLNTKFVEGTC